MHRKYISSLKITLWNESRTHNRVVSHVVWYAVLPVRFHWEGRMNTL